jgi:L-amino acid N-acyltransferase YncA
MRAPLACTAAAGFTHVGVLRSVGWKFGRLAGDVVLMEKHPGRRRHPSTSPE